MDILELYSNEKFNNLLDGLANKKKIKEFDDYRQDVFLEILETEAQTNKEYVKCANRVASRYYRSAFEDDIYNYGINDDGEYSETEEEIMSRLIYQGRAKVV